MRQGGVILLVTVHLSVIMAVRVSHALTMVVQAGDAPVTRVEMEQSVAGAFARRIRSRASATDDSGHFGNR